MQRLTAAQRLFPLVLAFSLASARSWAQSSVLRSTGAPGTIYDISSIDDVDLSSGNLRITIPLVHLPGRGLDTDIVLSYNSKIWKTDVQFDPVSGEYDRHLIDHDTSEYPAYGWSLGWPRMGRFSFFMRAYDDRPPTHQVWVEYVTWIANDGTRIRMVNDNGLQWMPPGGSVTGHWSIDGTYARSPTGYATDIVFKDGVTAGDDSTYLKDTNGNSINCTAHFPTTLAAPKTCTDTLGRTFTFAVNSVTYGDSSGTPQTITFTFENRTLYFPYPTLAQWDSGSYPTKVLKSITLANNLTYQFEYVLNPDGTTTTGEISKIILPTGGYIRYVYDWTGGCYAYHCGESRAVLNRIVSEDGTASSEKTWQYSVGVLDTRQCNYGSGVGASVTDPLGNVTLLSQPAETTKNIEYKNPAGAVVRKLAQTIAFDNGSYNDPFTGGTWCTTQANPRVTSEITILSETNQQSKVESTYGSRGNVTQRKEYDWGAGAPGALVRPTDFAYLHDSDSTYAATSVHILDRVTSQIVYDAASVIRAQTNTTYDGATPTGTSGIVQHNYTTHPATNTKRGNPTSISRWRNSPSGWLTTTNVYNDVGNLLSTTDPGGHTTTFSYADNFFIYTPAQPTSAYVSQITLPSTGGISHIERKQYYFHSGLVAATCGQNYPGATPCAWASPPTLPDHATFSYDSLHRPTLSRAPGGTGTNIEYNEAALPISIAVSTRLTASSADPPNQNAFTNSLVTLVTYDGLGRTKKSQLKSNPGCVVSTDTTFDAVGRKATVTNPYCQTSEPTFGITSFEYDPLNRVAKVIPPDGTAASNNVTTTYSGNTTTVTDQSGKQRRSYADALGRLVRVDEPGPSSSGGTAGAGSVTISGAEQSRTEYVEVCQWIWDGTDWVQECTYQPQTVWDTGTVTITVNGMSKSVSYGQNSTPSTIATALRSAINGDSGYPVTAAGTGSTVSLTSKVTGTVSNYPLQASSATNDPAHFTVSFTATPSGPTLTGGTDGTVTYSLSTPTVTTYAYDVLDNLTNVLQAGSSRTFTYDSLSQLLTATNPESGTITYAYDVDGNLITKTAPAPNQTGSATVTTCFGDWTAPTCNGSVGYDALHRLLKKTYSNGNPAVTYSYDQSNCLGQPTCSNIGRRTGMTDAAGSESWAYDLMGRPQKDQRTTGGVTKTTTYSYNLDGSVATLTYPSGRTITYSYNAAARAVSAIDSLGPINYATDALYAPTGALASLTNGAGLVSTFHYNNRLQPCRISVRTAGVSPANCADTTNVSNVLDLKYDFALGVANNGTVMGITNNRDPLRSQTFTYDALNRVSSAKTNATYATSPAKCWGETFSYDIWANLKTIGGIQPDYTGCTQEALNVTPTVKNQLAEFCHDAAGNLVLNTPCPQPPGTPFTPTYSYNAENQLVSTAGVTYTYDGDGKRIKKSNGNLYWYGMGPDPLTETDLAGMPSAEFIFFNGKRIARLDLPSATVHYYFSNHLGSASVVTSSAGMIQDESDYYPFGGERVITNTDPSTYKFTGKERDSESGLDYFGARYYGSSMGRFSSTDPKALGMRHLLNPQKLNKYTYVLNNPLSLFDPNGMEEITITYRTFIAAQSFKYMGNTYSGDARGFSTAANASSRSSITVRLETDASKRPGNPIISQTSTAGPSQILDGNGKVLKEATSTSGLPTATGTRDANGNPVINITQDTKNPLSPVPQFMTPGITANLTVTVPQDASNAHVTGTASVFPAQELNVTRADGNTTPVVQFEPAPGATPTSLFKPDRTVDVQKPTPQCSTDDKGKKVCTQ